jgi:hypothetical protein
MNRMARDAGLRLLSNRRHLSPSKQALWLYYFMVKNPNKGAARHNVTMEEIKDLVTEFNLNKRR